MKFALSYSCGKESSLALHRLVAEGHEPVCLITVINAAQRRSYFHGADPAMLRRYAEALGSPIVLCPTDGSDYAEAFERGLERARELGAEAVAFGDIDIEEHRRWEEERCANTGLQPLFPLWGQPRQKVVEELLELGFRCIVKCIDTERLPRTLLGKPLTRERVRQIAACGADPCGENGEYHTLVTDGPPFIRPLELRIGSVVELGRYAAADIRLADEGATAGIALETKTITIIR